MGLGDVSTDGVRAAVAEYDRLGREAFLRKYKFRRAREYFLVIEGKRYDSKAIVGVAHGMSGGGLSPLTASDFAGGEATVARVLGRLGFELHRDADVARPDSRRNPPWSDEELILALDLYLRDGPLDGKNGRVVELSKVLNALTIHADRPDAERFRNPNSNRCSKPF